LLQVKFHPIKLQKTNGFLLKNQKVVEKHIKVADLIFFEKARLINAMLPFESGFEIPVDAILT
jgi:hypothetical protein